MKSLVVYYSRTGSTEKAALSIAEKLNADIEKIIDLKSRKGALGYLAAGKDAVFKKLTRIKEIEKNPGDYDLVLIGTPVWVGTMSPAVRTYLTDNKIKKSAFFCTAGANSPQRCFIDMLDSCIDTKLIAKLHLTTKEVRKGEEKKIDEFVGKLA